MFCWLVWTIRVTSCFVEIGGLRVYSVLIFILLIPLISTWNNLCMNPYLSLLTKKTWPIYIPKSYFELLLFSALSSRVLLCFYLCSLPFFYTRLFNPCLSIWVYIGGIIEVLVWGIRCTAIAICSMYSWWFCFNVSMNPVAACPIL